jgi:hypothetical protein
MEQVEFNWINCGKGDRKVDLKKLILNRRMALEMGLGSVHEP